MTYSVVDVVSAMIASKRASVEVYGPTRDWLRWRSKALQRALGIITPNERPVEDDPGLVVRVGALGFLLSSVLTCRADLQVPLGRFEEAGLIYRKMEPLEGVKLYFDHAVTSYSQYATDLDGLLTALLFTLFPAIRPVCTSEDLLAAGFDDTIECPVDPEG